MKSSTFLWFQKISAGLMKLLLAMRNNNHHEIFLVLFQIRGNTRIGLIKSAVKNNFLKTCTASFPRALLLLIRFSCVRLCATPQMAAHQAPPSLGFSRQEHWSGLPFPSPMHESESEGAQSYWTLSDPMDCSLPGSSIHGIFQARVLEWVAIALSHRVSHFCSPS